MNEITGKGLQPYIGDLDSKGESNRLDVIKDEIIPIISSFLGGHLLDVGCGNGRLNNLLKEYVNRITGIDMYREPNPIFSYDKFLFRKCSIMDMENTSYHTILFYGSFYLHHNIGYKETLIKARELTSNNIIIIDDYKRLTDDEGQGFYSLSTIKSSGLNVVVNQIQPNKRHRILVLNEASNNN